MIEDYSAEKVPEVNNDVQITEHPKGVFTAYETHRVDKYSYDTPETLIPLIQEFAEGLTGVTIEPAVEYDYGDSTAVLILHGWREATEAEKTEYLKERAIMDHERLKRAREQYDRLRRELGE